MSLGHTLCGGCHTDPAFKLHPCGHLVCQRHYLAADSDTTTCGHCGQIVMNTSELEQKTPTVGTVHPRDTTWSHSSSSYATAAMQRNNGDSTNGKSSNGGSSDGMFNNPMPNTSMSNDRRSSNGGTNNSNDYGNGYGYVPQRNAVPMTPTPAPRNSTINEHGVIAPPRYVPPMFRDGAQSEIRPDSSISQRTFASQVPMTPTNYRNTNGGNNNYYSTGRRTDTSGQYSFNTSQLTQQMAQLDVFRGAPPRMQPNMNGNGIISTRPTLNGMNGLGNGNVFGTANGVPTNTSFPNDSAVSNPRAHRLAALIRSGAADDPSDPDYGNPGPSRRVPQYNTSPAMPISRGLVIAAAGQNSAITSPGGSAKEPNINGNGIAFVNVSDINMPAWFNLLDTGFRPNVEQVMEVLPLIEACRVPKPTTAGVIRIRNLPYSTSRSEITAFLGRNAQIILQPPGTAYHAVHILMERQSGKTLDAFIELENHKEVTWVVNQFRRRVQQGRTAKIGDRSVVVELSSQQEFMKEMFPRAKNVTWHGPVPKISTHREYYYKDKQSSGFIGFLQDEEIVHMSKHAETPQRSPFAQRCLVRTYECLISTIHKYPWFAVDHVLIHERHNLFECTKVSVAALINFLLMKKPTGIEQHDITIPSEETLKELTVAALTCPGFTESQKAVIVAMLYQGGYQPLTQPRGMNVRFGGTDSYSDVWPFQSLLKHPGAPDQLVKYVAGLFYEATGDAKYRLPDNHAMHPTTGKTAQYASIGVQYNNAGNLADVGRAELRGVEAMLRAVLPSTGYNTGSTMIKYTS